MLLSVREVLAAIVLVDCCVCESECDGSLMRTDPRYNRVKSMITAPEVPRTVDGTLRLRHTCQRRVHFAGGFNKLLIKIAKAEVCRANMRKMRKRQSLQNEIPQKTDMQKLRESIHGNKSDGIGLS